MRIRQRAAMLAVLAGTAMLVSVAPVSAGAEQQLPVFNVVKAGLTSDEASPARSRVRGRRRIRRRLRPLRQQVLRRRAHEAPAQDGQGRVRPGHRRLVLRPRRHQGHQAGAGRRRARHGPAGLRPGRDRHPGRPQAEVSHTQLRFKPRRGKAFRAQIDTSRQLPDSSSRACRWWVPARTSASRSTRRAASPTCARRPSRSSRAR